jgi:hypothetical protein
MLGLPAFSTFLKGGKCLEITLLLGGFCFTELRYDLPALYNFHKKKSVSLLILACVHSVLKSFAVCSYFHCFNLPG